VVIKKPLLEALKAREDFFPDSPKSQSRCSRQEKQQSESGSAYDPLMPKKGADDWSSFRTHSSFYDSDSSDREWLNEYKLKKEKKLKEEVRKSNDSFLSPTYKAK
jgi:hypothetical protein